MGIKGERVMDWSRSNKGKERPTEWGIVEGRGGRKEHKKGKRMKASKYDNWG